MENVMGTAIPLREDFNGDQLRGLARRSVDSDQTRRLLSLATIYEGGRRQDAAKVGGVTLQIIRDWVMRFNADGADGLLHRWSSGPKRKLTDTHRQALVEIVECGPDPAIHGVVRWRRCDLTQWLYKKFGVLVEESTVGRTLRELGYRKLTARPRHYDQKAGDAEDFKKTSRRHWRKSEQSLAKAWKLRSGGRTRRVLARRTSSQDVGPNVEPAPVRLMISERNGLTFLVPSAQPKAKARGW
jgi:transposase